jgi:diaminohydroxyphosphoribosylaminopyrimidine deaminase/5-amino-6-(5-phosphoribosylamino)uracil reductase
VFVLPRSGDGKGVALLPALELLGREGVLSLLVEGGPRVISSFLREGLGDHAALFLAGKFLGQGAALTEGLSFPDMRSIIRLRNKVTRSCGDDLLVEGEIWRETDVHGPC